MLDVGLQERGSIVSELGGIRFDIRRGNDVFGRHRQEVRLLAAYGNRHPNRSRQSVASGVSKGHEVSTMRRRPQPLTDALSGLKRHARVDKLPKFQARLRDASRKQ